MARKPKRRHKKGTMYGYFLSYLLIVVLVLLFFASAIFTDFISQYEESVISEVERELESFGDTLSQRKKEMDNTALQIAENANLTPFMVNRGGYNAQLAVREMLRYNAASSFASEIFLVSSFQGSQSVAMDSGIIGLNRFLNGTFVMDEANQALFLEAFENGGAASFVPRQQVTVNRVQTLSTVLYLRAIPLYSASPYAMVVFQLDGATLDALMEGVLGGNVGYVYMFGPGDELISSYGGGEGAAAPREMLEKLSLPGDGQQLRVQVDGVEYFAIRHTTQTGGLSFVYIAPARQVLGQVLERRQLYYYLVAAVLVLGALLSFVLARRHYRPIGNMLAVLDSYGGAQDGAEGGGAQNDWKFINASVARLMEANAGMDTVLHKTGSLRRRDALVRLFSGSFRGAEERAAALQAADIRLEGAAFVVVCAQVDDAARFYDENSPGMQALLKYGIANCAEELAQSFSGCWGLDYSNNLYIDLLLDLRDAHGEGRVAGFCREVGAVFEEQFSLSLSFGASGAGQGCDALPELLRQARAAVDTRLTAGWGGVHPYRQLPAATDTPYPAAEEHAFVIALQQGQREGFSAACGALRAFFARHGQPPRQVRFLCNGIINTLTRTRLELGISGDGGVVAFDYQYETLPQLEELLWRMFDDVHRGLADKRQGAGSGLYREILEYIEAYYIDSNLTLTGIAERFGVSASYIARVFKENGGATAMQYADRLRMKKARQLLRETQLSLQDILDAVGYVDRINFSRKFKKAEGVTPMRYRELYQGNMEKIIITGEKRA